MKKKKISAIVCLLGVVVIVVGVVVGVIFKNDSISSGTEALEYTFGNFVPEVREFSRGLSPFNGVDLSADKDYYITTDSKINSDGESFEVQGDIVFNSALDKLYYNGKVKTNYESGGDFDFSKNPLDLTVYDADDKIYFKVNDVMDDFYYIKHSDINEMLSQQDSSLLDMTFQKMFWELSKLVSNEQLERLSTMLEKAILANVKDKDFKEMKVEIELGGQKFTTTRWTLDVSEELLKNITIDFLKQLKQDKEYTDVINTVIKNYAEMIYDEFYDGEETPNSLKDFDIVEYIDMALEELPNYEASKDTLFIFAMYGKGKNIVRYEFVIPSSDKNSDNNLIAINAYENSNHYGNFEVLLLSGKNELAALKMIGTSKTTKNISVSAIGQSLASGIYENTGNKISISLESKNIPDFSNFTLEYTREIVKKGTQEAANFKVSATGDNGISTTIESNNKIYLDKKIPDLDLAKSKNLVELAEKQSDEIIKIAEKLEEKYGK